MKKQNTFIIIVLLKVATIVRVLLSLRYKISVKGSEILKKSSPLFILPNHQALIDPFIIMSQTFRYTKAIPVVSSTFYDIPLLKSIFLGLGAVRVSNLEAGSRNTNVLNEITRSVLKGFGRGKSVVLYPSGQLAVQGYEKIFNKKSAHKIVSKIPDDVKVIGVRITGLWGSMWSKARTGQTPNLFVQILKGFFYILANLIFFLPRRTITIEIEDLTLKAKTNAQMGIKPFNLFLEDYYNFHGEENPNFLRHFFIPLNKKANSSE
ncbi:MAG: 1-acyl-sn-glycerol-3-phosphate acyltransferase [Bacteroidetes bacterium]|nr:1-acyl-sn-glycerol-3-phosphate acyltransferase [Bacteroidota bacterium]